MKYLSVQSGLVDRVRESMSRRKGHRLSATAVLVPVLLLVGMTAARVGWTQSACAQLGVDCSHHGGNSTPRDTQADEDRRQRMAEAREARREQHARDAAAAKVRKQQRDAEKAKEKAQKDQAKREADAAKAQQKQAALDRKAAEEAARRQAHGTKPQPPVPGNGQVNPVPPNHQGAGNWADGYRDPQVKQMASRLMKVVPPMPIPASEVQLDWKRIYLNGDRLEKATDLVVAGWEMAGLIEDANLWVKGFMIGGKALIGAEDGAYVFLCKRDMIYDAALHYLKDPTTARDFARLVDDLKHNRSIALGTNPMMLIAAKLIADPHQGSVAWATWDAMSSPEARSAALRKASVEAAGDLISAGMGHQTNGFFKDVEARKAMYDSIRLERTAARKMLAEPGVTAAKAQELQSYIHKADEYSSWIYKTDPVVKRVKEGFEGQGVGKVCDEFSKTFSGPELKGREY